MSEQPRYKNAALPVEERVADLLSRMTLEEKLRQLIMENVRGRLFKQGEWQPQGAKDLFRDIGIGAVRDMLKEPEIAAPDINKVQQYLVNETRLGIPALVIAETLHGLMTPGSTIFPQAIGLASSWNTELIKGVAATAAKEARAVGVAQSLAPDLDLARDARWGRVEETYGECPYLVERMAVAYITGLQGTDKNIGPEHIAATIKHFAAHGSPESGLNLGPVSVGERELRTTFLPPFEAAIKEAGALCVMPAYSEFDGIPVHISKFLLDTILRKEWGFEGYVIADFGAAEMVQNYHHTVETLEEAGKKCFEAGLDLEAPSELTFKGLRDYVERGEISEDRIDQAVARVLRVKFLTGLFENPYADPEHAVATVRCNAHLEQALQAAHETMVLLKNDNNLLPLDASRLKSVAVIGPNSDYAQLGDYSYVKETDVTPLQGLRDRLPDSVKINHAEGCTIWGQSTDGITEAVRVAKESDLAILFVGGASATKGGIGWGSQAKEHATCGEGYDRTDLDLPGKQQELVEAVVATGTPTVVVLINGRPLSITWINQHVPAILEAWYPGEQGGYAIADVLLGRVNPSGKLPISFPKTVGQVPVFYNHKPSARGFYEEHGSLEKPGRAYVFMDPKPLYEFGYGLSYTTFEYADLKVSPAEIRPGETVQVSVDVKNTGGREGKEVVQLYINDVVSSCTTPVKQLRAFAKINLKPGETQTVTFTLGRKDMELLDEHLQPVVEPGKFEVMVGGLKSEFRVR